MLYSDEYEDEYECDIFCDYDCVRDPHSWSSSSCLSSSKQMWLLTGYGSIPIDTIFSGLFTSMNPSYFDVNYRGTIGFDTLPHGFTWLVSCAHCQVIFFPAPQLWFVYPSDLYDLSHWSCFRCAKWWIPLTLPSGKRLHNYGKSPFLMGKSTVNCHFQ